MIKYLFIGSLVLLTSCNDIKNFFGIGNTDETSTVIVDSTKVVGPIEKPNNIEPPCKGCGCFENITAVWQIESDSSGQDYLVRGDSLNQLANNPHKIVKSLNSYSKVKAKVTKVESNTIYIDILNDAIFNNMGSEGVNIYMVSLVFSLTDGNKFNKVDVNFNESDHAVPGVFNRKYFESQEARFVKKGEKDVVKKVYIVCPHRIDRD